MWQAKWAGGAFALSALLSGVMTRPVAAQTAVADLVFERTVRERWMNAHQSPAFTPWNDLRISFRIAGIDESAGRRAIRINAYRVQLVTGDGHTWPTDQIAVAIDSGGRIVSLVGAAAPQPGTYPIPAFSAVSVDSGGPAPSNGALPATLGWDAVPAFHPRRVAVGARWVDTIAWSDIWRGSQQRIAGVRTSTIVGDSVVNGIKFWRVRDRMQATYHERVLSTDRTFGKLIRIDRRATGVIRGEYLYDPVSHLSLVRTDTTELRGTAVLTLPDGRTFATPTRYERMQSFVAYDAGSHRRYLADVRRAEVMQRASERLPASVDVVGRDQAVLDSLLAEWSHSRDPAERGRLRFVVMELVTSDDYYRASFHDRLDRIMLARGDTALVYDEMLFRTQFYQPLDTSMVSFLLPFLRDPGRAFAFGFTWAGYEALVEILRRNPLVNPIDSEFPAPTRTAREMLAREWYTAKEPRLRDVALAALLTLDPAKWNDTVLARAHAGDVLLGNTVDLIEGRLRFDSPPLPAVGGSWRGWAAWADDEGGFERDSIAPPDIHQVGPQHKRMARFVQLRTGRDLFAEWQQQLAAAPDDSARYVFERLLLPFHLWTPPSLDSIATLFRFGNPYNYARASNAIGVAFPNAARPADSATGAEIVNRVLTHAMDGDPLWPTIKPSWDTLPPDTTAGAPERGHGLAGELPRAVYVYLERLPAAVRARWNDRLTWVADSAWKVPHERYPASRITIGPIMAAGPFLRVWWTHVRFPAPPDGRSDYGNPEDGNVLLMRTAKGWVIVPDDFFYVSD